MILLVESRRETRNPIQSRSRLVRGFYIAAGSLCLGLGALGVILPILPTTPFVLVAAACYARSSPAFYDRLLRSRLFGPLIRNWREHRAITLRAKIAAIFLIIVTLGSTIVFLIDVLWLRILLAVIGLTVIGYLMTVRTRPAIGSAGSRNTPPEGNTHHTDGI